VYWLPRKKVLVPTDLSDASVDAIHTALSMVEFGHCVHAVHVVEPVPAELINGELPPDLCSGNPEELVRRLHQEKLNMFLMDQGFDGLGMAALTGDPALSITRYARENEIDLIIMLAHDNDSGERTSIGTVTEQVLHNADCPVLVLRPDGRVSGQSSRPGLRESNGFSSAESQPAAVVTTRPR